MRETPNPKTQALKIQRENPFPNLFGFVYGLKLNSFFHHGYYYKDSKPIEDIK